MIKADYIDVVLDRFAAARRVIGQRTCFDLFGYKPVKTSNPI